MEFAKECHVRACYVLTLDDDDDQLPALLHELYRLGVEIADLSEV